MMDGQLEQSARCGGREEQDRMFSRKKEKRQVTSNFATLYKSPSCHSCVKHIAVHLSLLGFASPEALRLILERVLLECSPTRAYH